MRSTMARFKALPDGSARIVIEAECGLIWLTIRDPAGPGQSCMFEPREFQGFLRELNCGFSRIFRTTEWAGAPAA